MDSFAQKAAKVVDATLWQLTVELAAFELLNAASFSFLGSIAVLHRSRILFALLLAFGLGCDSSKPISISNTSQPNSDGQRNAGDEEQTPKTSSAVSSPVDGPAPKLVGPLAEAYRRVDPLEDGWRSEQVSENINKQLKKLAKLLHHADNLSDDSLNGLLASDFSAPPLQTDSQSIVFSDGPLQVMRAASLRSDATETRSIRREDLAAEFRQLLGAKANQQTHVKFKLTNIELNAATAKTVCDFEASIIDQTKRTQLNAIWHCTWDSIDTTSPELKSVRVEEFERVQHAHPQPLFVDGTWAVLGRNNSFQKQLSYGSDHWRARIARSLGQTVAGHHGIAVGDANGDGLDDVYVCQEGGLPNRLYVRQKDGTFEDKSAESGADWLDYTASALFVDLDNDGDRDLVIAFAWRIVMMSNDGQGKFKLEADGPAEARLHSLAAADFDGDSDVDIYVCGYMNADASVTTGVMGSPVPYHDANNGGANMLLRNDGGWKFHDAVAEVGLDENNSRFSFAASWEDFDNDGDLDLYVANDFGRNNLYRNEGGKFVDVAREFGVEDMSAGMSTSWGDYNNDGWMDLYVSNMFSSAGNRITYQPQFRSGAEEVAKNQFRRHARGNTLFQNVGGKHFKDLSMPAAVNMGRWAWSSNFVDINNDGWQDLIVANGFVTAPDTHDL